MTSGCADQSCVNFTPNKIKIKCYSFGNKGAVVSAKRHVSPSVEIRFVSSGIERGKTILEIRNRNNIFEIFKKKIKNKVQLYHVTRWKQ